MIIIMYIYNWCHSIATSIHLYTQIQIAMFTMHSPCFIPLAPLAPLYDPLHLLGTLRAVTGSVHLGLCLLVNCPLHFPSLAHIPRLQNPDPLGFLTSKYTFIRMASRTWLTRSRTIRVLISSFLGICEYR
jgi:hypothetical protein